MQLTRRRLGALAGSLITAAGLVSAPALAGTPSGQHTHHHQHTVAHRGHGSALGHVNAAGRYVGYAVNRQVCQPATSSDRASCMAVRQVPVPAGTPGAYRYSIPASFRSPGGGYTPSALAAAYHYRPLGKRSVTVGIVDAFNNPSIRFDLNHFDKQYGIRAESKWSFRVVNEHGGRHHLPRADKNWAVEIALDVEAVRAVCHRCKIVLVLAQSDRGDYLAKAENTAVRLGADIVSNSYGSAELPAKRDYQKKILTAYNHPNVVTLVSSGDDGYNYFDLRNGDPFGTGLPHRASFPAVLPDVVSVGGTSLHINTKGQRTSETVWDTNGAGDVRGNNANQALGASGGGCSIVFNAQPWQKHTSGYKQAHCKGKRLAVDAAVVGDPNTGFGIYDRYAVKGWGPIGGTSLSSPLLAGMYGLVGGKPRHMTAAHALYSNKRLRASALFDVRRGGNGWCGGATPKYCSSKARQLGSRNPNRLYAAKVDCSYPMGNLKHLPKHKSAECNAQRGYDGPSGVGTPVGLNAFRTTLPLARIRVSTPRKEGKKLTFVVNVRRSLRYSKIKLREWSFGDGTKHKQGSRVHHTFKHGGHYTIRVKVRDNRGQHITFTKRIHVHRR